MTDLIVGTDGDNDGMSDAYESAHGLNPALDDSAFDLDGDGLSNLEEHDGGSHPNNADTDGDGLDDDAETVAGTNPLGPDSDGDGLSDGEELSGSQNAFLNGVKRDPFDPNTDPPGDPTDPLDSDSDNDGVFDQGEVVAGSDPNDPNSFPPLPTPIGYWPFDDQQSPTEDLSPNGNDGTVTGVPQFVPGHSGEPRDFAIKFDGVSSSVTTGVSLLNGLSEYTMAGWVKFEVAQPNRTGLFGQNDTVEFGMINSTTLHFWIPDGGPINVNNWGPSSGGWRHLAVVKGLVDRRTYIDGVEMVVGPSIEPSRVTVNTFNIGGSGVFDAGGNWFNGEIDDVAVWDVALEPDDIMLIATGGLTPLGGRPGPDPVPPVVRITVGIQGAAFAVTATGMAPTRSYILRRSVDGQVFTNVGTPFTGNSDHVFIDLTPLAGIALYQIWEVTP
jgi:hypothetical protein